MKENIGIKDIIQWDGDRFELLRDLEYVLRDATGDGITLIDKGSEIIIDHGNDTAQKACVECDSLLEMAYDIMKAALHGEYFRLRP